MTAITKVPQARTYPSPKGRRNPRHQFARLGKNHGQSIIEMALVLPILLLLLVGTIEIGRFAYYAILVSNAARAGAQYGAQSLITSGDTAGIQTAARNDGGLATLTVTPTQLCGCSGLALGGCPAGGFCANPLVYVQVNVSQNFPSLFHYPGLPASMTLSSTVKMRVTQ